MARTRVVATAADELDALDDNLVVWAREIPDLDPLTEGIVERIQHLAHGFDASMAETLATTKLDRRAFNTLGKLRSIGAPYRRSAGMLASDSVIVWPVIVRASPWKTPWARRIFMT